MEQQAAEIEGGGGGFGGGPSGAQAPSLTRLNAALTHVYDVVSAADAAPTTQALAAASQLQRSLSTTLARWSELKGSIGALNQQLKGAGLPPIDLSKPAPVEENGGGEDEP